MKTIVQSFTFSILLLLSTFVTTAQDDLPIPPVLQIVNETASAVAWSPDGTQLAVGDATGVRLYTRELAFIRLLAQPTEQMKTLAWSLDGSMIAAGGGNDISPFDTDVPREAAIHIWDAVSGEHLTQYEEHESYVPSIAWSPDSQLIASGSWDRTIQIWHPRTGATVYVLFAPRFASQTNEIMSMGWSSNGQIAAVVGNGALFIWESFQHIPRRLPAPAGIVSWSPNGDNIALPNGYFNVLESEYISWSNCRVGGYVAWSPSGELVAIYTWRDGIVVCNAFSDRILLRMEGVLSVEDEPLFGYQYSIDWHPDGTQIAGAGGDGFVRIWDVSEIVSK